MKLCAVFLFISIVCCSAELNITDHSIAVCGSKGIGTFTFNSATGAYDVKHTFTDTDLADTPFTHIVCAGKDFFAASKTEIFKLNGALKIIVFKPFKDIAQINSDFSQVYVAAQGGFFVFDTDLREKSAAMLNCGGIIKNAHDIMINGVSAYLLDNITAPVFAFKYELGDELIIKNAVEFSGVCPHLDGQWIDADGNWQVVMSTFREDGTEQRMYRIDSSPVPGDVLYTDSQHPGEKIKNGGLLIQAMIHQAPAWCIAESEGKVWIARQRQGKGSEPFTIATLLLEKPQKGLRMIKQYRNLLIILYADRYLVVDVSGKPEVVLNKPAEDFGFGAVTDICVF